MLPILLIVGSRCHFTLSNSFCLRRQSQPNPLCLKPITSAGYPRNGLCQTQLAYLACFQQLSLEKGRLFSKKIVKRSGTPCLSPYHHDVSRLPSPCVVMRQRTGHQNIPTIEAGKWFGISGVPGKFRIGRERQPISHNTSGKRGRNERRLLSPELRTLNGCRYLGTRSSLRQTDCQGSRLGRHWERQASSSASRYGRTARRLVGRDTPNGTSTNQRCGLILLPAWFHNRLLHHFAIMEPAL